MTDYSFSEIFFAKNGRKHLKTCGILICLLSNKGAAKPPTLDRSTILCPMAS